MIIKFFIYSISCDHRSFTVQALEVIKKTQLGKSRGGADSAIITDPLRVFHQAIDNCKPVMGTVGVRRGGKLYHVSGVRNKMWLKLLKTPLYQSHDLHT